MSYDNIQVELIDCTAMGDPKRAAALLVFAKNTRLQMRSGMMDEILAWDDHRLSAELDAIARTIPSAWEFVNYTLLISNVTRAFTHQFVRTRHASFAQQTMRVLNVADGEPFGYQAGPTIDADPELTENYASMMKDINDTYQWLIKNGASVEDARGVLPTNIETNIVVSMNLRTLVEMLRKRSTPRVQGEYQWVLALMRKAILAEHPWANLFLVRTEDILRKQLYAAIEELTDLGPGESWTIEGLKQQRLKTIKLVDELFGSK